MADSRAFGFVCDALEQRSSLDRLEARGTVRIACRGAGLEVTHVTPEQMVVLLERVLPGELDSRGIADGRALCDAIRQDVSQLEPETTGDSPEKVFERLGG
ncbi:MAG: hypothetical protein MJE66_10000 [Proteobacteria bacterium]|nr:hypothetical protein [Pseudomonadota bacterium]